MPAVMPFFIYLLVTSHFSYSSGCPGVLQAAAAALLIVCCSVLSMQPTLVAHTQQYQELHKTSLNKILVTSAFFSPQKRG